ncbi:MAG: tRNA pseudouridine(38-40) synthase TruA, partial [Acidimicrobiia bacterium]|nr:tRNA pseudouridine(38-40) synthase TruA [Acidimicrobiia bacterium]
MAEDALRNVRLTVAYDGTDLHGFAPSQGVPTVMGTLNPEIERIVRRPVDLVGAGRTDAGVHAWGQVVSGPIPLDTDLGRLTHSLNRLCGPAISVRRAEWADRGFSARFSAASRTYRYSIWNLPAPNPLVARFSWHVAAPLDVDTMNAAATDLLGDNDFSSFCRRPKVPAGRSEPSLVRRLTTARWVAGMEAGMQAGMQARMQDGMLEFEITASAFCHQMVRSIVGTLVDVGLGRRAASSVAPTLAARDRQAAGQVAPPTGLVLWSVDYTGERW